MSLFSYHLVNISLIAALKSVFIPTRLNKIEGLIHGERMTSMKLGSPIISLSRMQFRKVAFFAQWENEKALDDFLNTNHFGKQLAKGW